MNKSFENIPHQENDLTFRDFVVFFWANRKSLVIAALVGLFFGALLFHFTAHWQKVEIRVYPIQQNDLATIDRISQLTEFEVPDILPMDLFFQAIQNRANLTNAALTAADELQFKKSDVSDFLSRLDIFRRFPDRGETEETIALFDYIDIKISTRQADRDVELLEKTSDIIEQDISGILSQKFLLRISEIEEALENKKESVQLEIENQRFTYQENIDLILSELQENIDIAKSLGIKKDLFFSGNTQSNETIPSAEPPAQGSPNVTLYALEPSSIPDYYRGYEALQIQYNQIAQRTNIDSFIPELVELKAMLNELENSSEVELLKKAYANSILGRNEPIVLVDKNNAVSKRQIPALLTLGMPVLLFLLLTIGVLIIMRILKSDP